MKRITEYVPQKIDTTLRGIVRTLAKPLAGAGGAGAENGRLTPTDKVKRRWAE